jgi:hypothetical protein
VIRVQGKDTVEMALTKIVSGGQTGVDRGALDAALAAGFPCGGWCPADRRAEDGPIIRHFMPHPSHRLGAARKGVRRCFAPRSGAVSGDAVAGCVCHKEVATDASP